MVWQCANYLLPLVCVSAVNVVSRGASLSWYLQACWTGTLGILARKILCHPRLINALCEVVILGWGWMRHCE